MSWFALIALAFLLVAVISQFGKRLAAKNSIIWWTVGLFIIVVATSPEVLKPLSQALGIQLVSNFVLAGLILFLFLQVLELTAESTAHSRTLRKLTSSIAAENYIKKLPAEEISAFKSHACKVLVLLPCFNEQDSILQIQIKLDNSISKFSRDIKYIVCFVDDGSVDKSREILKSRSENGFASHPVNIGVSGVILTGFAIAKELNADYVVQFDADGQHPPEKIEELVKYSIVQSLDLVIGSRFAAGSVSTEDAFKSTTRFRILGILIIRRMLSLFGHRAKIKDPTSGFRVYSRRAQDLLSKHMPDEYPEPESIAILAMQGATIGEIHVEMEARATGISSINGFKTIRFMAKVLTALLGLRLRTIFAR